MAEAAMMAKSDDNLSLITELKQAIRASGLSYAEVAKQSGVAHSQISRFMSGKKTITVITAARLYEFFRLSGIASPSTLSTNEQPEKPTQSELMEQPRPSGKRK